VSGLPRVREWDAFTVVEILELEASELSEFEFRSLGDGTIVTDADVTVDVLDRLARWGDEEIGRSYAASVVRQDRGSWAVGLVRVNAQPLELPEVDATTLQVVRPPDGSRLVAVDGEEAAGFVDRSLASAADELERRARGRFEAFVARADRLDDGRWELTVDPL
jgi:hypothetical protein